MIIEFCGLPGTGKTTVVQSVSRELKIPIVEIAGRGELLLLGAWFALKHPRLSTYTLYHIARNSYSARMGYYKLVNCFLQRGAKYEKASRYPHALIIEGYWQNIIAIFEHEERDEVLARYARTFPSTHAMLFVAGDAARTERMFKRGRTVREEFPQDRVTHWVRSSQRNSARIEDLGQGHAHTIQADGEVDSVARRVVVAVCAVINTHI
ncbi:MAG: hypothetical protein A2408_02595 [Candidatus Yonathbacteria bacterium RIFOXYC1_FULL_52_10]|uniref:ATPase AAA-type core domain-containing protein n=1 Tax=Candidatus Yonathbacteria bacterium RIFOXYD1_FULL_52_36 TaxID=1802730 RepID=A0A1G2SKR6_9BACT|nr:MAG: hypothetical protein A2408_02595 [Candidatus Yonathbacteria bacterium RIFOXYC1_FULL_52_10]OHA85673.1 MAG: hypothetical protein A2591_02465 [Candidatus Yonathbacteria bacterium RIFOXYD1_FULL_52_36]